MASIQFYLREKITNDKKEHPVYVRLTANQQSRYGSLDIWVKKNQWNQNKQEIRKTQNISDISAVQNELIAEIRTKFKTAIREAETKNRLRKLRGQPARRITADTLKEKIFGEFNDDSGQYFIQFARDKIKRSEQEFTFNTLKKKRTVVNKLETYIQNNPHIYGSDILFSEITIAFLKEYYRYLREEIGNVKNTARRDITELGVFFNNAIKEEAVDIMSNPFSYVSFPTENPKKAFLTAEELNRIISLDLKQGSLIWNVRNYFFFQIYTAGLRVSDLCVVTWDAIIGDRFEYTMRKTNQHKSLILVNPAQIILSYYDEPQPGQAIFPILRKNPDRFHSRDKLAQEISSKSALINKYLKKIEKRAGLKKHISTHIARHTFANTALNGGWSKLKIQKALGHTSIRVTERYLSSFEDYNIDDDMQSLFSEQAWIEKMTSVA